MKRRTLLTTTGGGLVVFGYALLWLGPETGFTELSTRAFAGMQAVLIGAVLLLFGSLFSRSR